MVQVITSDVRSDPETYGRRRVVAVLTECPSQHDGLTIWFTLEIAHSRTLTFHRVNVAPIRSLQDLTFGAEWENHITASVEFLDGTVTTIELIREYGDS